MGSYSKARLTFGFVFDNEELKDWQIQAINDCRFLDLIYGGNLVTDEDVQVFAYFKGSRFETMEKSIAIDKFPVVPKEMLRSAKEFFEEAGLTWQEPKWYLYYYYG